MVRDLGPRGERSKPGDSMTRRDRSKRSYIPTCVSATMNAAIDLSMILHSILYNLYRLYHRYTTHSSSVYASNAGVSSLT